MLRFYVICAFVGLGLYGIAQYRGWSVLGSDAEEFQRSRAERAYHGGTGSSRGSGFGGFFTGGTSGHK
jgi:hypothetical protein